VVGLPRPRDPIATKALPRFQQLRERIFDLIEGAAGAPMRRDEGLSAHHLTAGG